MEFSGPISREKYRKIYTVFVIVYTLYEGTLGLYMILVFNYLKGSVIYFAPFLGLQFEMVFMLQGVEIIREEVSAGVYKKGECCGLYQTVRTNIIHATLTMLGSVVTIAFLIAFFIRNSKEYEISVLNKEVFGIVCTVSASCILLTAVSTLLFSVKLRKELLVSESAEG